jgi:O-antigen ligase
MTVPAARARYLILAITGVLFTSIVQAHDAAHALWLALSYAAIAYTAAWMSAMAVQLSAPQLSDVRRAVLIGLVAGAAYLAIEQSTGRAVIGAVYSYVPALAGKSQYTFLFDDGGREVVRRHVLNRGTGALTLLLWPLLLLAVIEARRGSAARWVPLAVFALACAAVMLSAHEASKVALAVSVCLFALAFQSRRAALALVLLAWAGVNAAVVPAVRTAYDSGWQLDTGLTGSARARITIWNFTATRVSSAWLFGHGIDSVRNDDNQVSPKAIAGEEGQHRTGRHSHNVFLQIWYEFGLAGSLLWTAAGFYLLSGVHRFRPHAQPFAIAGATAGIVILSCSWGLWQHWYAATVAASIVLFAIAAASERPPLRQTTD